MTTIRITVGWAPSATRAGGYTGSDDRTTRGGVVACGDCAAGGSGIGGVGVCCAEATEVATAARAIAANEIRQVSPRFIGRRIRTIES